MPNVVDTATRQRKTLSRQVDDGWRKVDPAVKPGFYRMPICRYDVGRVSCYKGAYVTGHYLFRDLISCLAPNLHQTYGDRAHQQYRRRQGDPGTPTRRRTAFGSKTLAYALFQRTRRLVGQSAAPNQLPAHVKPPKLGCAAFTLSQMESNLELSARVEFAIEVCSQHFSYDGTGHGRPSFALPLKQLSKRTRARLSRDMTVPSAMPAAVDISLYESSSSSRRTTTSRYSGASA